MKVGILGDYIHIRVMFVTIKTNPVVSTMLLEKILI